MKIQKIVLFALLSMSLSIYACKENEPTEQEQPQEENPPRQESLQGPQCRRAMLLQTEGLQAHRNAL